MATPVRLKVSELTIVSDPSQHTHQWVPLRVTFDPEQRMLIACYCGHYRSINATSDPTGKKVLEKKPE